MESLALSGVEWVDDIIKRLAWAAKLFGGSRRKRVCDLGSRARDWEIEDHDLVTEEKSALQKGMNFGVGKKYSVFLMSLRENAPYADAIDEVTGMLLGPILEQY
jgi:hypothetical protein